MAITRARGCLALNDHAFFAVADRIYDVLPDGTYPFQYGSIGNDNLPVYMAANRTQLAIVSNKQAFYIDFAALKPVPWLVDFEVIDVGFINGYFVFLAAQGDGFYFSEPGDVSQGSTVNFISAEANANLYKRLHVKDERIWLVGDAITQIFYDQSSVDPEHPFAADLSGVIPQGSAAAAASAVVDNALCWIGKTPDGFGTAWMTDGFRPQVISTFAVAEAWRKYPKIDDAWGYSIQWKGHRCWRIWFPTANETWEYDTSLPYYMGWRKVLWRNPASGLYEADRGSCACSISNLVLVGDRDNGKIHEFTPDAYDDDGDRIRWLRRAPIINAENRRIRIPGLELMIQPGVGDGSNLDPHEGDVTPEADPQVMLRISYDWGQNWGNERTRKIGKQGQYNKRVFWWFCGSGYNPVVEVSGSDSVPIAISDLLIRNPVVNDKP
jgi:hypothetical protein